MITFLPIDRGKLIAVSVHGKLTHEDYRDRLIPRLLEGMKEHGKVRLFCVLEHDYGGITPAAMWDELKFDAKHRKDFERAAIVTDDRLVRAAVTIGKPFFSGEIRLFRLEDRQVAEDWVREGL